MSLSTRFGQFVQVELPSHMRKWAVELVVTGIRTNELNMEDDKQHIGPLHGKFEYKKNQDGTVNRHKVLCTLCRKEFSFHRSTSSLKYHINAKHTLVRDAAITLASASPGLQQTTLTERRGLSKSTSDKLTDTIAKWIATNCRPINIVEDTGFTKVLQVASQDALYKAPTRSTIMSKIHGLYETEKEKKHEDLAVAKHVALTGDYWTSVSNSNYLSVTAHLITSAWELKSFALRIMKTEERHFAEARAEHFLTVAREWEIEGKITTVGTDCARNMTAAAKLLPFEHMPCVAHILQRCITVSLGDSGFVSALSKCRKIVGHFKHSPANASELETQQTTLGQQKEPLIQDVPTRWNSTLEMVKRLNRNQAAIKATLDQKSHKLVMLTLQEWDKLQKLESVLEPCKYVTEILGGESYVSCSVVLPALCHLHRVMETSDDDPAYVARFKTAFQEDLTSRQENYTNNEWLKIATALDPRFKDLKCLPKSDRERVWTTLGRLLCDQSPPQQTCEDEPPKKISLLQMGSDSESDEELLPDRIMHLYRAEPIISMQDCPLEWWSAHSGAHDKLALLACKYLATPATTVPCERLFSVAGNIVNKKRSALLSDNVNKLVCLSNWLKEE